MIKLNLISQESKDEIKLKHVYGLIKRVVLMLFILLATSTSFLLFAEFILRSNFNRIVEETTLITKNAQGYNQKAREINAKIASVSQIQSDYVFWSYLLEEILKTTPSSVSFHSFSLDKNSKSIQLSGNAKTREGLLAFEQNLKNNKIFQGIDFPIKNILQKNDINFEINFNFDMNELKINIARHENN